MTFLPWFKNFAKIILISSTVIIISIFLGSIVSKPISLTFAESLEEIQNQIKEAESELSKIKTKAANIQNTLNNLSGKLNVTKGQINSLQSDIDDISSDITNLNRKMDLKKLELDQNTKIRNQTLRNLYITNRKSLLELLLEPNILANTSQAAAYHFTFINNSENLIGNINRDIKKYESDKNELEEIKEQVEKQKDDLLALASKLSSQVSSTKNALSATDQEKAAIQKKLSELSAKQQELLAEKTETFSTSVGDVPLKGDPNSRADYNPGFKKAFAAFSFGAPHRKGMSQYGAKGRAESGQDYKEILRSYYGDVEIKEVDLPKNIRTTSGTMELDGRYLKGLAEMPSSWPSDALKAQAIAARTYAMSYVGWRTNNTNPGGRICTTESCQVWSSSKASSSSAAKWHDAVSDTKGVIMISKKTGEIFSAWYASTSGGYNYQYTSLGHTTRGGWDTKCSGKDCWTSKAYENIGGSSWFYKGWYKTRSNKSCGRSHPWLTEKEFADIVGALVLYEEDENNQKHLSQPDAKSCWGKDIGETWSRDKVREKSGIKEINDVDVSYSSGGVTAEVKIKTNKGEYKFSGGDFKAIFNLRAPGSIHLKSLLFNVEVRD